jgi:hypothetical protein
MWEPWRLTTLWASVACYRLLYMNLHFKLYHTKLYYSKSLNRVYVALLWAFWCIINTSSGQICLTQDSCYLLFTVQLSTEHWILNWLDSPILFFITTFLWTTSKTPFFYCCVRIHFHGNVFTEPLLRSSQLFTYCIAMAVLVVCFKVFA